MKVDRTPRTDGSKTNRYPGEVQRKESLLHDPHVAPLTAFVDELRAERGGDETVPWFDPTEAGVNATILLLMQAPGRKAALRAEGGSRFVSADNDDPTADNLWNLLRESDLDRAQDIVTWNVVPWYVERTKVGSKDLAEARPALRRLIELLPKLRVVVLLGNDARDAWFAARLPNNAIALTAPHPSPLSLNNRAERRPLLRDALVRAKALASAPAPALETAPAERSPNGAVTVGPATSLDGHFAVPGDKSISHRALILGAIAHGETVIRGFGRSADTESTLEAVRALGVQVDETGDELVVHGVGLRGLQSATIDCGNAGTLARLIVGVLAFQSGTFTLTGDESLSARPMERVAEPLRRMGAQIETTDGHLPLTITGGPLQAIDYELPVASAQVKSAILLAGLGAEGRTTVIEPVPTRDHTELMLQAAGVRVTVRPASVSVDPPTHLRLGAVDVPGDFSSAAPFIVGATLVPESRITIHDVNLNPRRTGLLDVLERMGGRVGILTRRRVGFEQVGDLEVRAAEPTATTITSNEVPRLVDELPLFGLLASGARGGSWVYGAGELRHKETDRIEALVDALRAIGGRARAEEDGFSVTGVPTRPRGGRIESRGDHRIAMLGAIAGLVSREGVRIEGAECVTVSFPGFFALMDQIVQR